jgi:multiple sugar transport system permease protein
LIFVAVMTLWPLGHTLWLSLHRYNLSRPWVPRHWVSWETFSGYWSDPLLLKSLGVMLLFAVTTVSLQVGLGLVAALLLARPLARPVAGAAGFRLLLLLPMMVAPAVAGVIWRLMLNDGYGAVNWILTHIGLSPQMWLSPRLAFFSVVLAETWQWLPFSILLFGVGLAAIPKAYYEAAAVDGATPWLTFRRITLPNLKWVLGLVVIFKFSDAVKAFDTLFVMTGGGPGIATQTLALYLHKTGFVHFDMGHAAMLSLLLLAVTLLLIWPLLRRTAPGGQGER